MPRDFLPRPLTALIGWSSNFAQNIQSDPQAYGLTPLQCAAYQARHDALAALCHAARNPSTRTSLVIMARDDARDLLEDEARMLGRIIRANPAVTAVQRIELRLSAPRGKGSLIAAPDAAPRLVVLGVSGRTVRVRLRDAVAAENRGKPRGVASVVVLSAVADQPPVGTAGWTLHATSGRTRVNLTFDSDVSPGTKVWVTAAWVSARGRGPGATPAAAIIGIAGPSLAGLKLAA